MQIVFLCGARDFHAIDWYRSSLRLNVQPKPIILTDLIAGEGFTQLVGHDDQVIKLLILDNWLFRHQSVLGNAWRNILKAVVFPIQVFLIRSFAIRNPCCIYYAHSMYYIWLAWAAGVRFVATPQGSDILIKPYKSKFFRFFSKQSMSSALFITVDSSKMARGVEAFTNKRPLIIQNGIDINSVIASCETRVASVDTIDMSRVVSFRGLTPLYRIHKIIEGRNRSCMYSATQLDFVFPFYEQEYLHQMNLALSDRDQLIGRLDRQSLYTLFRQSLLCISIPYSDSSPRSVYEAIFCGTPVAVTHEDYLNDMPSSMRSRIILVNIDDPCWFDSAVDQALEIRQQIFSPCEVALSSYDQLTSFRLIYDLSLELTHQ
jgi:hypothetical protein